MNYATLVKTIKAYIENDFPSTAGTGGLTSTEQLDTFIRQAEQRIFNTVQLPELRKNSTGTLTTSNRFLTVPTDWLANYSLAVVDASGDYHFLLNKDVSFIREAFSDPTDTGLPTHYALFDKDSYIVGPTPDAGYTVQLHYFYYPTSIVDGSTSWLGDNFDSVLLYGSLLEAAAYTGEESDIMANYTQRYMEAMDSLKMLAEGKNRQDMYRNVQARYPVT
jgi:hypothetical protein